MRNQRLPLFTTQQSSIEDASELTSLVDLLRLRAEKQACDNVFTFLLDGEKRAHSISYGELDNQARAIAATLQKLKMQGERAILLYPPGLEFIAAFLGCLYAGVVAVPAYPPGNKRHRPLLQAIHANCQAALVLSTETIARVGKTLSPEIGSIGRQWLLTDQILAEPGEWRSPRLRQDALAFLQYTSGSTGNAKGVMVSHVNLMANQKLIKERFGHDRTSTVVGWLPFYHDMGLIGNIMQPLYVGAQAILMAPMQFLEKPSRWLRAISDYQAHTSGAPNFAYELCVRKITSEDKRQLDLSAWKLAFNGSEPIQAATLDRFEEAFACCGFRREAFYPCYGLAESTLLVSGIGKDAMPTVKTFDRFQLAQSLACAAKPGPAESDKQLVGCGSAGDGHQIRIVDTDTQLVCQAGQIGEIQVSGPSVAQGYWQNPEETSKTFVTDYVGASKVRWLRTGDLGFLDVGELFVSGRLKDLIIIRGSNYYPQDIEAATEASIDSLSPGCSVAFAVDGGGGGEQLVVLAELKRSELRRSCYKTEFGAIRRRLAEECGIQPNTILLLRPGAILKTTSGKIRRRACREAFEQHRLEHVAVDNLSLETAMIDTPALENFLVDHLTISDQTSLRQALARATESDALALLSQYLVDRVAALSGVDRNGISLSAPPLSLGMDSLKAVDLKYQLDELLGMELPVTLLLEDRAISEIAEIALHQARLQDSPTPTAQSEQPPPSQGLPLSVGQQAIWTVCRVFPESPVYNLPIALHIHSVVNVEALISAFEALPVKHGQLANGFAFDEKMEPRQFILPERPACFERIRCHDEQERANGIGMAIRERFSLDRGPLLRGRLFSKADDDHILLVCAHHIAVDFRSLVLMLDEIKTHYAMKVLGQLPYQVALTKSYSDYIHWQAEYLQSERATQDFSYWQKQLSGSIQKLELAIERNRPKEPTYRGGYETFLIEPKTVQKLKALAHREGATLYMLLLCLFKVMLYRYSGQQDLTVGSPTLGRPKKAFAELVGFFVNPIALRSRPSVQKSFTEYLSEVKKIVLDGLAHQDYPFSLLVEQMQPEREPGLSPFYRAWFVLQGDTTGGEEAAALALGMPDFTVNWPGLDVKTLTLQESIAQFDLALMMGDSNQGLMAALQYSRELFEQATIAHMAEHFQNLLHAVLDAPSMSLGRLPMLAETEHKLQLRDWNATLRDYPQELPIHQLFETQAQKTPQAIALCFEDKEMSYAELDIQSDRLANYLQANGVTADQVVGICLERSMEMIIGLLAILKAGAAYLPLDPLLPQERLSFMIDQANAKIVLTQSDLLAPSVFGSALVILMHAAIQKTYEAPLPKRNKSVRLENLAYCIYTSGSTGRPKGVGVSHAGILNRLQWMQEAYRLENADRVLQKTPYGFDVSVWEFFWPLISGATLVVAKPGEHQDGKALIATIVKQRITTIHFVPAMLQVFIDTPGMESCISLQRVICSGEVLSADLVERFYQKSTAQLYNLYGPTEASVDVTAWHCQPRHGDKRIPIGRPIANTSIYLLDADMNPVPIGQAAELYIGGVGLARAYLNQPALTALAFVPNPFDLLGGRLYKTGDLARFRNDGAIEYLGRMDTQVKIRGMRIELGEIESILTQIKDIREAVVDVREDQPGDRQLVAYIVGNVNLSEESAILKNHLRTMLPEYMIPSSFVQLAALPLSHNGKLDRKALPPPSGQKTRKREFVAPRDEAEEAIASIWRQVLGIDQISIHDDFFELGGHSLSGAQIMALVERSFDLAAPIKLLFESPTIAEFVDRLADHQAS